MSISTDLPTPDPATIPTRWPTPKVVSALSERMPLSKTCVTRERSSAPTRCPPAGQLVVAMTGPRPSIGSPAPSTARPRYCSPTLSMPGLPSGRTMAPGRSRTVSPSIIIIVWPLRKPMVSARCSVEAPCAIEHSVPIGTPRPDTSINPPSQATTRPNRRGARSSGDVPTAASVRSIRACMYRRFRSVRGATAVGRPRPRHRRFRPAGRRVPRWRRVPARDPPPRCRARARDRRG